MNDQIPLFVEDYNDAIRTTVQALGGFKKVGTTLRPEMPIEQAGRWLSDCINPDRRDRLAPDQLAMIRRLAKEAGVHTLMYFEAQNAGYAEPQPITPSDELSELQRRFIEATKIQDQIVRRMERLTPNVRVVA